MNLKKFENILHYTFKDVMLLEEALTHPSVRRFDKGNKSYQRLEFLGDKVLSLIIAEYLFLNFEEETEGEISKRHALIVSGKSCADIATKIGVGDYIILAQNQEIQGGRKNENILENTLEAIIGAIYKDGGFIVAKEFILQNFKSLLNNTENSKPPQDPKSALQERYQKKYKKLPEYKVISSSQSGFEVELIIEDRAFRFQGKTIKAAEKAVAEKALKEIFL